MKNIFYELTPFAIQVRCAAGRPVQVAALIGLVVIALCQAEPATAAELLIMTGGVQMERGEQTTAAASGELLRESDSLVIAPHAEALVRFEDGAQMVLRGNTRMRFDQLVEAGELPKRRRTLNVLKGGMRYVSNKLSHQYPIAFVTRSVSIGIRGTDIEIAVADEDQAINAPGTYLKVNTGNAVLTGLDGTQVEVEPGQVAFGADAGLTARGGGSVPRPYARRIDPIALSASGIFSSASLDRLLP